MEAKDMTDADVLSTYRTILNCYRMKTGSHQGMRDFTERSLAGVHQELARRNLPKDPTDDTSPDPIAGYRNLLVIGNYTFNDLLPEEGIVLVLNYAYLKRTNKPTPPVNEVLLPFAFRFATALQQPISQDELLARMCEAIERYHNAYR